MAKRMAQYLARERGREKGMAQGVWAYHGGVFTRQDRPHSPGPPPPLRLSGNVRTLGEGKGKASYNWAKDVIRLGKEGIATERERARYVVGPLWSGGHRAQLGVKPMIVQTYVKKADAKFEADFDKLPEVTQTYIINYGWRQCIADAAASAKDEKDALGYCQKRYDNLLKGIIRAERESDPVAKEARRLAVEMTNRWAKSGGVALSAKDDADAKTKAQVEANMATWTKRVEALRVHPDILAQAEKNVKALGELDIDIDI